MDEILLVVLLWAFNVLLDDSLRILDSRPFLFLLCQVGNGYVFIFMDKGVGKSRRMYIVIVEKNVTRPCVSVCI